MKSKILHGHVLDIEVLEQILDNSLHLIVTSPPYWGLRDYGEDTNTVIWDENIECMGIVDENSHNFGKDGFCLYYNDHRGKCHTWRGQLGLEPTFELYIDHLFQIFEALKPKLRHDGTLWVNLGDTYYGGGNAQGHTTDTKQMGQATSTVETGKVQTPVARGPGNNIRRKSLVLVPYRFAIKMVDNGWICRNLNNWHKPSTMPSSAKDRFTVDFEPFWFFAKNENYYFNQQFEQLAPQSIDRDKYVRRKKGVKDGTIGSTVMRDDGSPMKSTKIPNTRKHQNKYYSGHSNMHSEDGSLRASKVPYSVQPRDKDFIEYRKLPDHDTLMHYLRDNRIDANITIQEIEDIFKTQAPHHWFERDGSFPSAEDWKILKRILHLDDTFDERMTTVYTKSSAKQSYEYGRNKRTTWDIFDYNVPIEFISHLGLEEDYINWLGDNAKTTSSINPKGFKGAHFAVYPKELVRTPIVSSVPKEVCTKCDKPKITEYGIVDRIDTRPGKNILKDKTGSDEDPNKGLHRSDASTKRQLVAYGELGVTSCKCNAPFKNGIVLDPFFGAGTTGVVAKEEGVTFIGIDINKSYIKIASKRIKKTRRLSNMKKLKKGF